MTKSKSSTKNAEKIPKTILLSARFLELIFPRLAVLFAAKLFTTPVKHKIPKRELEMDQNSKQTPLNIPEINKEIIVYQWGNHSKKVLLVHGWSGRGTQLFKIAEALVKNGYSVVSFDAPSHGKSAGNSSIMLEFIASVKEIEKKLGSFEAAIGHSLGGMALFNAAKDGLKINHLVTIGSGDVVKDIIDEFINKLQLKKKTGHLLSQYFEKKYDQPMNSLSAYLSAKELDIPVLVIHDENDDDVPVSAAIHIHKHLKNGSLMITKKLGHRKILGDELVIKKTIDFIQNKR